MLLKGYWWGRKWWDGHGSPGQRVELCFLSSSPGENLVDIHFIRWSKPCMPTGWQPFWCSLFLCKHFNTALTKNEDLVQIYQNWLTNRPTLPSLHPLAWLKNGSLCEQLARAKRNSEKPINTQINPIRNIFLRAYQHCEQRELPLNWEEDQKENNHISWSVIDCVCMSPLHSGPHTSSSWDPVRVSLSITTVTRAS